ncbi:hypothetical protein SNUCP2_02340 [Clostridium perfringens A]
MRTYEQAARVGLKIADDDRVKDKQVEILCICGNDDNGCRRDRRRVEGSCEIVCDSTLGER